MTPLPPPMRTSYLEAPHVFVTHGDTWASSGVVAGQLCYSARKHFLDRKNLYILSSSCESLPGSGTNVCPHFSKERTNPIACSAQKQPNRAASFINISEGRDVSNVTQFMRHPVLHCFSLTAALPVLCLSEVTGCCRQNRIEGERKRSSHLGQLMQLVISTYVCGN